MVVAFTTCKTTTNNSMEYRYQVQRTDFLNSRKADSYQIYSFQIHLEDCNFTL